MSITKEIISHSPNLEANECKEHYFIEAQNKDLDYQTHTETFANTFANKKDTPLGTPKDNDWENIVSKSKINNKEILRDEIGLWEDLTESLTKELFTKGFTNFFKDITKALIEESDLYEKLIENCGIYWLINRLFVLWNVLESKGAKICSVALIQLPSDSDEFKSKMLVQLFLNNTVKEIVELSIKTIPESFQIFNHKFEKEILNKRVSFILHKAD